MIRLTPLFARAAGLAIGALFVASLATAAPLGSSFTYQGKLAKDATAYAGPADFVFRLYDDPAAGTQVGGDVSLAGVTVAAGLFTVELDFGAVFDGTAMWLEIAVQTPGDADYTVLAPRQLLSATPYALHALSAPGGVGSEWTVDTYGIMHPGNVGIGTGSRVDRKFMIDAGTSGNAAWIRSNDVNYATLAFGNDAIGGFGLYDGWSDKHYLVGRLGIGTTNPTAPIEAVTNLGAAARLTAGGSVFDGVRAALFVAGVNGTGSFGAPSGGIYASSVDDRAISGWSTNYWGVSGDCTSAGTYGILGTPSAGVYGSSPNITKPGGHFVCPPGGIALDASAGLAKVKTLQILGADLAESFPVAGAKAEPGTVLMLTGDADGRLRVADEPYSARVAGVVSGANGLEAGVVLKGESFEGEGHAAVALSGRVWVKCDATREPIRVGDLLTTSDAPGRAMRASDRERAHGTVLGKAMTALDGGTGMVLVLVNLQ